jgi:hypothetical protein
LEIANDEHEEKTSEVLGLPERPNAYSLRRIETWEKRGEGEGRLP